MLSSPCPLTCNIPTIAYEDQKHITTTKTENSFLKKDAIKKLYIKGKFSVVETTISFYCSSFSPCLSILQFCLWEYFCGTELGKFYILKVKIEYYKQIPTQNFRRIKEMKSDEEIVWEGKACRY